MMLKKLILVITMSLLMAVPAFASAAPKTVVQVAGSSQKEISPDIARISLSVQSIDANLDKVKNDHTSIVNRVLDSLKAQGVTQEQIKTNTYQVNPVYTYEKNRLPVLKGYRVTESLEISTSLEKVGLLVNEVTNAGANEINSIRFETTNETESKNEALQDAVRDAVRKAEVIAAALNKKVVRVSQVNESGVFYQPVQLDQMRFKVASTSEAAPNIPEGKVTVSANVQVTVELE